MDNPQPRDKTPLELANEARRKLTDVHLLNPIEKAKLDPRSKVKALRAYYWDMEMVVANQGTPDGAEQRRIAEARYRDARAESRKPDVGMPGVIRRICFVCVGADADGPPKAPTPQIRVRDCSCRACPLHPVRPWQGLKGRKRANEPRPEGT